MRKFHAYSGIARRASIWAALCMTLFAAGSANAQGYRGQDERCQALEQQLVSEWQRGQNPGDETTRIDQQLAEFQSARQKAEVEAEKRECYEDLFIFGRSLRRTRACIQLDNEIETLRRNITTLRQQREALTSSAKRRGRREELVAELARYGCGENYERESAATRRRSNSFFSFWEDDDTSFDNSYVNTQPDTGQPFASYRTMCVRLCDGYYFPISYSTLSSRFPEDEAKCQDQCAAPAQLFTYRNPGEEVEQMVSLNGQPYSSMPNAFRNRKEYVKGCSCKASEYSALQIQQSDSGVGQQAGASEPQQPGNGSGATSAAPPPQ